VGQPKRISRAPVLFKKKSMTQASSKRKSIDSKALAIARKKTRPNKQLPELARKPLSVRRYGVFLLTLGAKEGE